MYLFTGWDFNKILSIYLSIIHAQLHMILNDTGQIGAALNVDHILKSEPVK